MQVSCNGVSCFWERFCNQSRMTMKLLRRVSWSRFLRTKEVIECLMVVSTSKLQQIPDERYPVERRSSRTELLREFKQNSPKTEDVSCIWADSEVCINVLLNATVAAILRFAVRERFEMMWSRIWHSSSLLTVCELLSDLRSRHLGSQILQVKLSSESTFLISVRFPDNAQGIVHKTHKSLSLSCSDRPMYDVLCVISQHLNSWGQCMSTYATAQLRSPRVPLWSQRSSLSDLAISLCATFRLSLSASRRGRQRRLAIWTAPTRLLEEWPEPGNPWTAANSGMFPLQKAASASFASREL